MDFQPTQILSTAKQAQKSPESLYWRSFKNPVLANHLSPINQIATFSKGLALCSNARVIIHRQDSSVKRTISRFKDVVYCADFRSDGKMLAAGDATGLIQLFDPDSRSILRTLRGHTSSVRSVKFLGPTTLLSTCDDACIKIWDIPTEKCTLSISKAHSDYIRTCAVLSETSFVTGSYDKTVKIWDKGSEPVQTLLHGAPVECVLVIPGGSLIASCGSNTVKVWDILTGKCVTSLSPHQKTITCISIDGTGTRLMTASLDCHVKVYSLQDWKLVHSVKYPAPLLSIGMTLDSRNLAVGMTNGLASIRQRIIEKEETGEKKSQHLKTGSWEYFMRGASHTPSHVDVMVQGKRAAPLQKYDRLLKKFQYSTALDSVLNKTQPPSIVVGLMRELVHRDGLKIALANRDDISLEPLARFVQKHIAHPDYSGILIDVANLLLGMFMPNSDMYAVVVHQSPIIDELFMKISQKLREEVELEFNITRVLGIMDCIFNASSINHIA